ncbi:uncharacterized protein LOC131880748 [Tigriopus californicus]|uniref:uncharacterized protein LOC131880748 n=1 Tax=Tigriopus californicus TaxID=6832 RepID=UPI0027DA3311|nr:uncharacterized protein LOC131880748 [Tigriopus californicus]
MTLGKNQGSTWKIHETAWVHCENTSEITFKAGSPFHVQATCIIDHENPFPTWTSAIELDEIVCQQYDQACQLTAEDITFPNAKPELDYPVGYWVRTLEMFPVQCDPGFYLATDRSKTDFDTTCHWDGNLRTARMGLEDVDADENLTRCVSNIECPTDIIIDAIASDIQTDPSIWSNAQYDNLTNFQYNDNISLFCSGEYDMLKASNSWVKKLTLQCQWNTQWKPSLSLTDLSCEDRSCRGAPIASTQTTSTMIGPFVNGSIVVDSDAFRVHEGQMVLYRCVEGYRLAGRHTLMSAVVPCHPPQITLPDWMNCVSATTCQKKKLGNVKARLHSQIATRLVSPTWMTNLKHNNKTNQTEVTLHSNTDSTIESVIFYFNKTVHRSIFPNKSLEFCLDRCPMVDQDLNEETFMIVFNCSQLTRCSQITSLVESNIPILRIETTSRKVMPSGYHGCAELYHKGFDGLNGLVSNSRPHLDRCEMGWTYIYIRKLIGNQSLSSEDFTQQINLGNSFYWMGLTDITSLTASVLHELKVEFFKSNGENTQITYRHFRITEILKGFALEIGEPDLHNSDIPDSWSVQFGAIFQFANSPQICGTNRTLIGWFLSCLVTVDLFGDQFFWMGLRQSDQLKKISMAIRPLHFNPQNISKDASNQIWVTMDSDVAYGDRIQLFCPPGYGLLNPERESYTCDWAEVDDDGPFNQCIAKSCPFLPHERINLTNMVPTLTRNTNEVLINETISYHCKLGTFFEDNMTRREMNFTCQPDMIYEYDHTLSTSCVSDKKCTNWLPKPLNGQMSVATCPRKDVGSCLGFLTPAVFPFCSDFEVTWNYVYAKDKEGQVSLNVSLTPFFRGKVAFVFSHKLYPLNQTTARFDISSSEPLSIDGFNLEDSSSDYLPCILNVFCGSNLSHHELMEDLNQTELGFHNVVKYSCYETEQFQRSDGSLYGTATLRCDWNGQLLDTQGQLVENLDPCIVYACPRPPIHLNGAFLSLLNHNQSGNVVLPNNSVTYKCQQGRRFGPDSTLDIYFNVSCLADGNYSTNWPICEDPLSKFCPPLEEDVPNGSYSVNNTSVPVQTEIAFNCDWGFSVQSNASYGNIINATSQRFYCDWNQTWDTSLVYPCERTHCTAIPNGTYHHLVLMEPIDMVSFETTVVYQCDSENRFFENDKFQQTLELECMPDGLLYPLELTHCLLEEEVFCLDPPPMPPPGANRFWADDEISYNSTAMYMCQTHKESQNVPQIESVCQWNKNWTLIDSFTCQATHCPGLPNPPLASGLFYSADKSSAKNLAFIYNDGLGQPSPNEGYVLPVPRYFADERVLIIDGLVLRDESNQSVQLVLMNYINGGYHEIHSIDLEPWLFGEGSEEHFLLQIEKRNSSALNITNMDSQIQGIQYNPLFQGLKVKGRVMVNFIGLVKPDESFVIPVGGTIVFECPHNQVLTSRPYLAPTLDLFCGANGAIDVPNPWPECVSFETGMNISRTTISFESYVTGKVFFPLESIVEISLNSESSSTCFGGQDDVLELVDDLTYMIIKMIET